MNTLRRLITAWLISVSAAHAAPVFSTGGGSGVTTDLFDVALGAQVIHSTNQHNGAGASDVRQIFGLPSAGAWVEPGSAIFADGPGAGFMDVVEWQTPGWINLVSISLRMAQDGASAFRGCGSFALFASQDGVNFSQVSGGSIPLSGGANVNVPLLISDSALSGVTANVRAFRLEISRLTAAGPRVVELDGFGSAGARPAGVQFLDRLAFNSAANTYTGRGAAARDDEGPGPVTAFTVSSRVSGTDTVEDAFGNKNGTVEPESFIFGDSGSADNRDAVFGNDGEEVSFIEWQTPSPLTLGGFRIVVSGDGPTAYRDTELVRFLVNGEVVDCFDNNGADGAVTRSFVDGAVTGTTFRIEFTRTTATGQRIFDVDAITAAPVVHTGGVVLNEVCAENDSSLPDEDGDSPDWVELYNNGDGSVNLSGWGLSDDALLPFKWTFPAGTVLAGRRFLIVFASDKNRAVVGQPLHANWQIRAAGEAVFLTRPDTTLADSAPSAHLRDDVTLGRHPNGTGVWRFFVVPSPGKTNTLQTGWESLVYDKPAFSVAGGTHAAAQALGFTSTEPSVTIRYTLDGSDPVATSPIYTAPLLLSTRAGQANVLSMITGTATVNQHTDGWKPPLGEVRKATVVRTRAFRVGAPPGPVGTQTYFIGADGPRTDGLPVLSIASTPAGLFDYVQGIYMLGKVFDDYVAAYPSEPLTGHTPANYTQRGALWERESHLEWFEPGGLRAWGEPIALDIQGQSSRSFRQKSFGVKARGAAGVDNRIGFPIFPGLTKLGGGGALEDFRNLRLRNFGNDWDHAMMRDSFAHGLARGLELDVMSSRPASIYLDGEYWGILEIRENQDARYLQAHYGFDNSEAVIVHGAGSLEDGVPGDELEYTALLNYCATHNLANQPDYDYVAAHVDVDNVIRYFLAEIWFANADWPQNNIRVWRRRLATPNPAGRWRWFVFDVDLGMGHPWTTGVTENTLAIALAPNGRPSVPQTWGTQILRSMLQNPAFKERFLNAAATTLGAHFSPARAVSLVNTMEATMLPGMEEHRLRWQPAFGTVAGWQANVNVIRNFAQNRAATVRSHFLTEFALGGTSDFTLNGAGGGAPGGIRAAGILLDASVSIWPATIPYFNGQTLDLVAVPAAGWEFSHWTGVASTVPTATTSTTGAKTITAHFIPAPPKGIAIESQPGAQWRITVTGTAQAPYKLQWSEDLATWTDSTNFTTAPDGTAVLTGAVTVPKRFYRASR